MSETYDREPLAAPEPAHAENLPKIWSPGGDGFYYATFTEDRAPALADIAWHAQGLSYLTHNIVSSDALLPDGRMSPDIDKARGPGVVYYLCRESDDGSCRRATSMRLVSPGPEGYKSLPSYARCESALYAEAEAYLTDLQGQGYVIREAASFAGMPDAHPLSMQRVFRRAVHDVMLESRKELWLVTMAAGTYPRLAGSWGGKNIQLIGRDVVASHPILQDLKPALLQPCSFIDNLANDCQEAEGAERDKLHRSLLFFMQGLRQEHVSAAVWQYMQEKKEIL